MRRTRPGKRSRLRRRRKNRIAKAMVPVTLSSHKK